MEYISNAYAVRRVLRINTLLEKVNPICTILRREYFGDEFLRTGHKRTSFPQRLLQS